MPEVSAREGSLVTEVAEAANVLARLGLVTAYGHVSARAEDAMLITPAGDLARVTAAEVVSVPLAAAPPLPAGVPAEAWVHLALYRARPDAAAIARAQPVSGFAAAAMGPKGSRGSRGPKGLVPLHGQAAWLGESIPVHDSAILLRSPELAQRAASLVAVGEALLLRGNGAITLGATPGLAVARMWVLAAACEIYLAARGTAVTPLSADEIASWRAVGDELLPRLWQHLRHR
jgi:HCOMODA/2-hydroxy-3-carboxy-muconic semialdehyde decarboxylase